jgi:hypothetical protein
MKDTDAFEDWLNSAIISSGGLESRRDFIEKHCIRKEDLEWAFVSGRMSLRKEELEKETK